MSWIEMTGKADPLINTLVRAPINHIAVLESTPTVVALGAILIRLSGSPPEIRKNIILNCIDFVHIEAILRGRAPYFERILEVSPMLSFTARLQVHGNAPIGAQPAKFSGTINLAETRFSTMSIKCLGTNMKYSIILRSWDQPISLLSTEVLSTDDMEIYNITTRTKQAFTPIMNARLERGMEYYEILGFD